MTKKKWGAEEKPEIQKPDNENQEVTELEDDELEGVTGGAESGLDIFCPNTFCEDGFA